MEYSNCPLYELHSKKYLCFLLRINNKKLFDQAYVSSLIDPYIDTTGKPRLIESPHTELKLIQKRISNLLREIEVPTYIYSGIKGRSYADNAISHSGALRFLYKLDLTAFFPSISRNTVYRFFYEDMKCSADVASILTSLTTVDLSQTTSRNNMAVYTFLDNKSIKCTNHLMTGAPTSQVLSYLVNHKMFDEMHALAEKRSITMTVYVDDITFSSVQKITRDFKDRILRIIDKYGFQVSRPKIKSYSKQYPKLVTGVVINKYGQAVVKNSLQKKIIVEYNHLLKFPEDSASRQRLRGLVTAARQVEKDIFPTIHKYAFKKDI